MTTGDHFYKIYACFHVENCQEVCETMKKYDEFSRISSVFSNSNLRFVKKFSKKKRNFGFFSFISLESIDTTRFHG